LLARLSGTQLSEDIRDLEFTADTYKQALKTFLFSQYYCVLDIKGFLTKMCYIKFTFDIRHSTSSKSDQTTDLGETLTSISHGLSDSSSRTSKPNSS